MPLRIFRTPNLAAANLAQVLLGAAWIPTWYFLNLYLQQVLGLGAFEGGAALLPMTLAIMVMMVVLAPRVIARFGPKAPIVAGMLVLAAGMAWLSLARADGSFAADVLPASLVAAVGMALAFIPSLGTAIQSARPEEGGLASGIVNTSYQVGSALGLAAMTALATSQGADRLGTPRRSPTASRPPSRARRGSPWPARCSPRSSCARLRPRRTSPPPAATTASSSPPDARIAGRPPARGRPAEALAGELRASRIFSFVHAPPAAGRTLPPA
jgi:MFS family permease